MRKIISLFKRDYEGTRQAYDEIVPGAEWVVAGEGVATSKWDGAACLWRDSILYRRYDCKQGKSPPAGWVPGEDVPDEHTGHWPNWVPGWVPVTPDNPADKWYAAALAVAPPDVPWTYELIGPHFRGNPYGLRRDFFVQHGRHAPAITDRTFAGVRAFLEGRPDLEGLVWWRASVYMDCDKVKIKRRDFGLPWPTPEARRAL